MEEMEESWITFHNHTASRWQNQDWISHSAKGLLITNLCSLFFSQFYNVYLNRNCFHPGFKNHQLRVVQKFSIILDFLDVCDYFSFLIPKYKPFQQHENNVKKAWHDLKKKKWNDFSILTVAKPDTLSFFFSFW